MAVIPLGVDEPHIHTESYLDIKIYPFTMLIHETVIQNTIKIR